MNGNNFTRPSFDPAYTVWVERGSTLGRLLTTLASMLTTVLTTVLVRRPAHVMRTWWERHRERVELLGLDDGVLRDLGITHADAVGRWRRAFWQA